MWGIRDCSWLELALKSEHYCCLADWSGIGIPFSQVEFKPSSGVTCCQFVGNRVYGWEESGGLHAVGGYLYQISGSPCTCLNSCMNNYVFLLTNTTVLLCSVCCC
jgi:hypothetical protein